MNGFDIQNAKGVSIQEKVKAHLESRGNKVTDVSNDKDYQKVDIDFIVENENQSTTLEVKMDNNLFSTKNLFFEGGFMRGNYYCKGWLFNCEADYMCFYDNYRKHGIIINLPATKLLLEKHGTRKDYYDKIDSCPAYCILLPLKVAFENNVVIYEWED